MIYIVYSLKRSLAQETIMVLVPSSIVARVTMMKRLHCLNHMLVWNLSLSKNGYVNHVKRSSCLLVETNLPRKLQKPHPLSSTYLTMVSSKEIAIVLSMASTQEVTVSTLHSLLHFVNHQLVREARRVC